ncbi:hypothetical protein [Rhizohabitans arisaemae]|uniref:hypothetical protein n=1 Tax=Rhizohabitans arisaemae TaxID=2720610 RepID=UPI0024B1D5DC|nr:hypothetical protein [Rhizohabitans arisaemae]
MVLVLRAHDHLLDPKPGLGDPEEQEIDAYAGGDLGQQMASLLALAIAQRIRSGGVIRHAFEDDPLGSPLALDHYPPTLSMPRSRQLLPRVANDANLHDSEHYLNVFARFPAHDAVAVMRAAHQYADALWWADLDPRMSWIKLFGALEAAADNWDSSVRPDPVAQLKRRHKGLHDKLERKHPEALQIVAKSLSRILGAESKMIDFILNYAPDPPAQRPEFGQIDWTQLEPALHVLYDHRSRDLHGGIPFPEPLCSPPFFDINGVPTEAFPGHSASSGGAIWPAHRLPMYLHTFAYIAGEALRRWWLSLDKDKAPRMQ